MTLTPAQTAWLDRARDADILAVAQRSPVNAKLNADPGTLPAYRRGVPPWRCAGDSARVCPRCPAYPQGSDDYQSRTEQAKQLSPSLTACRDL